MSQTDTPQATTSWEPPTPPRGHVLVLPGRGDVAAHYRRFGTRLAADGYRVVAWDAPVLTAADADAAWAAFTATTPSGELRVVVGSDVAAVVAAVSVASGDLSPAALVVAGASTGDGPTATIAERTACPIHTAVLEASDAPAFETPAHAAWPFADVVVPALVIHGGDDPVEPADAVDAATASWPARELTIVAGGVHDVLNDKHHRSVAAEIVTFLERLRLDPSAAPILERRGVGALR